MPRYERDLRERARVFAVEAYRFTRPILARPGLRHAGEQLFRSARSIGANLAESDGLNTRRELAARFAIALREARETSYWLDVLVGADPTLAAAAKPLRSECQEFIAMTFTALKKLRS